MRLDLHGVLEPSGGAGGAVDVAPDIVDAVDTAVLAAVEALPSGCALPAVRDIAARTLRRHATIGRASAAIASTAVVERLVTDGRLVRDGGSVRRPGTEPVTPAADPALAAAMDRLERALAVSAPPGLAEAARATACEAPAIRELERSGRIVVLEPVLPTPPRPIGSSRTGRWSWPRRPR